MDVVIRSAAEGDLEAIHEILASPQRRRRVHAGALRAAAPDPRAAGSHPRDLPAGGRERGRVVGFGELITHPDEPRHRHVGEVNMVATHADWTRKGVGHALLEAMLDLADNWLNLARLALFVFTDNTHAVRLYERLGFTIEGTMPRMATAPAAGWTPTSWAAFTTPDQSRRPPGGRPPAPGLWSATRSS
jgi:putative acetyltransferase